MKVINLTLNLGSLCLLYLMKKGNDFRDSNHIAVLAIDALYFFNTNDFDANI